MSTPATLSALQAAVSPKAASTAKPPAAAAALREHPCCCQLAPAGTAARGPAGPAGLLWSTLPSLSSSRQLAAMGTLAVLGGGLPACHTQAVDGAAPCAHLGARCGQGAAAVHTPAPASRRPCLQGFPLGHSCFYNTGAMHRQLTLGWVAVCPARAAPLLCPAPGCIRANMQNVQSGLGMPWVCSL